jgi:hypothetical protein
MSKFGFGGYGNYEDKELGIISFRTQNAQSFTLTPAIDSFPTILGGASQISSSSQRVKAGESIALPAVGGGNTNTYIAGADWLQDIGDLKDLKVDPSSVLALTVSSKRLQRLKVGDEDASSVTSTLEELKVQSCPSLTSVDARNLSTLIKEVSLEQCPRLREALFGGTNVTAVKIAGGSKIEHLQLPDSITVLDLRNTKFLDNFEVGDLTHIGFLRLENNKYIDGFTSLKEAYGADGGALQNVRVIGFTYAGDATDVDMLANLSSKAYGIDSEGNPTTGNPVIEGTLNVAGSIYEDAGDVVKSKYPNLTLNVLGGYYFRFADPEVQRICAENWGDGTGITEAQVESVTEIKGQFRGNLDITTFNEFEKFIGVKSIRGDVSNGDKRGFGGCENLKSIILPIGLYIEDGVYTSNTWGAFAFTGLEFVGNLDKVVKIGENAFYNCTSLEIDDLSLPNLETLGKNAFYGVKIKKISDLGKLTTLPTATTSTQNFGDKSVLEEVVLPDTLTGIPNSCFSGYKCVVNADLSNALSIGSAAFYRANLADKELNLQSVQTLGGAAFAFSNITKVLSLGEVTEINAQAQTGDWLTGQQPGVFAGCSSLTSVILPSTLKKIGVNAFANCSSLTDMVLPDGLEVLNLYALKGCSQLRVDYLPESITTIGSDVFYENANMLDDVFLPNLTGTLNGGAFAKTNIKRVLDLGSITATGVSSVYWPTNDGAGPFAGCVELELLVLPPSLTSIQHGLAAGCTALKAVVVKATTPPTLGSNCFLNTNNCPIYVPDNSIEDYKTATNWSNYADRILPLSQYNG